MKVWVSPLNLIEICGGVGEKLRSTLPCDLYHDAYDVTYPLPHTDPVLLMRSKRQFRDKTLLKFMVNQYYEQTESLTVKLNFSQTHPENTFVRTFIGEQQKFYKARTSLRLTTV